LLSELRIFRGVAEPVAEVAEFADVLDAKPFSVMMDSWARVSSSALKIIV